MRMEKRMWQNESVCMRPSKLQVRDGGKSEPNESSNKWFLDVLGLRLDRLAWHDNIRRVE